MSPFRKEGFKTAIKNPTSWQEICFLRRQSIEKSQEPEIVRLQFKGSELQEQECGFRHVLPVSSGDNSFTSAPLGWVYLALASLLFIVSYSMLLLTLEPFQLGWKSHAIALGAAVATALAMHWVLESWDNLDWISLSLGGVCLVMMIFVHLFLSFVRAEVLREMMNSGIESSVEISDFDNTNLSTENGFYSRTLRLLKVALPFLALVPELVMGMVFHAALKRLLNPGEKAKKKISQIRRKLITVASEIRYRQVLPDIFEKEFTAGAKQALAERGQTDKTNKRIAIAIPLIVVAVLFVALLAANVLAAEPPHTASFEKNIVLLLDLSQSRKVRGYDGLTEFEKDMKAIERIIARISPGTKLTVVGITDQSFSKPYVIFEARVTDNPGYFSEKIKAGRAMLLKAWRDKSGEIQPEFSKTDIFGGLALASQVFDDNPHMRPVLVIFSDLQQAAGNFNFEKVKRVPSKAITTIEKSGLIPRLQGVEVYALGVSAAGRSQQYWESLKDFWIQFFQKAGAVVGQFSIQRECDAVL